MYIPIDTNSSDRVFINTPDNMSSTLIITNIKPWDAGNYFVRVENEIGSKNETFRIVVDTKSTTIATPTMNFVGGSVGAITGVVIIAVLVFVFRRITSVKGTPQHDNNTIQHLTDNSNEGGNMETGFDNVLPIIDEIPTYEDDRNIYDIYGNIQTSDAFWKSLKIKTLRDTVLQLKRDPVPLFKEFFTLQMGLKYDTKAALKPKNVEKNRYRIIYPYDASRVVLPCIRWDPDSDFINASYIDGYCKPRKYIAAQGPLENTISDTWRMIHSEDIKIIVMVTNIMEVGKKKCSKYWPDDRAIYGKCNVKLDQVEEYADFVVRHFTYNMEGTRFERQLIQFHYTSWPDKNVPATALSLVQFWRKVRQCEFVENTPWMVHCSAGVGRTGSFIALDVLYEQGKVDGKLNIPDTVNVLREQRISMVQTKEQYLYLHEVITELLDPIGQIINPENSLKLQSTVAEDKTLKKEFKAITESIASVKTEESDFDFNRMPDGLLPENMCKSIDMNVIPDDIYRPLLSSGNDFINAVYIPTYRENEKYIVTQFPLQNTVNDFVRLLWDHNIRDVVLLDQENNERHCYWPHTKNPLCLGPFVISLLTVDEATNCTTRIIDITLAKKRQSKQTVVHQFTAWPGYLNLCEQETLADFLQTISSIAGPVVVQCHDGYSRSGLFAALLCTVDRIKTDNEVAIADTVRLVKHRRKAAVTDMEQYTFCHEIVSEYLRNRERLTEENQEYVNMTLPKLL
ncbi:receptor-type tyrosine-protein phosphatase alpha-like [Mya arenaria]|uniref:receptor-type tyrosine-protein phosphatase alpha-like n=1 Tax=Mya arenaria TaxID=6604 RepID=UPI0022DF4E1E|nr:receptor-type tyrosine-protein phosphatase alpha-like [Mya arenaria]